MIEDLFPTTLSEGQEELDNYTGTLVETYVSEFKEINGVKRAVGTRVDKIHDTRTVRGESLKALKALKERIRDEILKAYPLNKQLNTDLLPPDELTSYNNAKNALLEKYEALKSQIKKCKTLKDVEYVSKQI